MPISTTFKYLAWNILKVYHPVFSAVLPMVNPILAVPRVFNILSLLIYVLAVVLSSLVHMVQIADSQESYVTNEKSIVVGYALIYLLCLIVLRPFFNYIKQELYLKYATVDL